MCLFHIEVCVEGSLSPQHDSCHHIWPTIILDSIDYNFVLKSAKILQSDLAISIQKWHVFGGIGRLMSERGIKVSIYT